MNACQHPYAFDSFSSQPVIQSAEPEYYSFLTPGIGSFESSHYPPSTVGTAPEPAHYSSPSGWIRSTPSTYEKQKAPAYSERGFFKKEKQEREYKSPNCAENGSCYGEISSLTGCPKTNYVHGYYRRDGTYVRGHYRSSPRRRR